MRSVICLILMVGLARAQTEIDPSLSTTITCDSSRTHCFGIHLHVAVDDRGPVATADWVAAQLVSANRHFAAIDVGWQIVGLDALPAEAARVEDRRERDGFAAQVSGTVLHVFVTGELDDVDVAGAFIQGVTWRHATARYVILSSQARDRVLAHELGHVFGLDHSRYPISIMNKRTRAQPPPELRTFAGPELAALRDGLRRLLATGKLADLPRPRSPE